MFFKTGMFMDIKKYLTHKRIFQWAKPNFSPNKGTNTKESVTFTG
jgi:hypothetical protein